MLVVVAPVAVEETVPVVVAVAEPVAVAVALSLTSLTYGVELDNSYDRERLTSDGDMQKSISLTLPLF